MDSELELVRKGFDPGQVQQLVGDLSAELKTMAAENDRLRARVAELEQRPPSAPSTPDDVFGLWSQETNALLDAARSSIASVTEKATADAAAAVAAGETAAAAIRQRGQLDADGLVAEARKQSAAIIADAEAAKAERESAAQATVDLANEQLAALEAKLADLRAQRASMSEQLGTAKTRLLELLSLVDEPEAAPAPDEQS